ncbi:MAG: ABC transporter permease subunit [Chloroherpetonaceae bacterium]|nr:ABC transporter permease subunit [Chthonomonadaceae bacterium]MDW8206904.1 ABC transporter permease subunit [Chloroherpetonaceae bacterium]
MNRTWQIAHAMTVASLLETVRRRELYVLLILVVVMTVAARAFTVFGVTGLEMFVKDMAFTGVGMFSTIIGVLIAARQLPEEIQRRTIYPMLARPITRWQFLVAKFLAAWSSAYLCFLVLNLAALLLLLALRIPVRLIFVQHLVLKAFAFSWLSGFTICLTIYMSPGAAATVAMLLSFGSGVFARAFTMTYVGHPLLNIPVNIVYALLPHYSLFDLTAKVVYDWDPIHPAVMLFLMLYGVGIGLFWLYVGWRRFQTQPI